MWAQLPCPLGRSRGRHRWLLQLASPDGLLDVGVILAVGALLGLGRPLARLLRDGDVGLGPSAPPVGLLHHHGVIIVGPCGPAASSLWLTLTLTRSLKSIN